MILTNHRTFNIRYIASSAKIVVDTRNATHGLNRFRHKIAKLEAPSLLLEPLRAKGEAA